ncbi:hypothetical protein FRB93_010548 [Tulasnella sp. JGI-2019a]|nr:hypothetical protein FRB93_010548 [Tulasnella sp. JGI-2019a]
MMGLAAGGNIDQKFHIRVTGLRPPPTPITRELYQEQGIPWFILYDDEIGAAEIKTAFKNLKTIESCTHSRATGKPDIIIALPDHGYGRQVPLFGSK